MPYLFLLASESNMPLLEENIDLIGGHLGLATTSAISDLGGDLQKVAVYPVKFGFGVNTAPLAILGLASWTEKREFQLDKWRNTLGAVWQSVLENPALGSADSMRKVFALEKVEVFPFLVNGSFAMAEFAAKMFKVDDEWRDK